MEDEEIWRAKQLVDTILHPDTKEKIPWPFRMNAHVPMNTILLIGMLSPGLYSMMFWQFMNQSFNLCQYYANRNATNFISNESLAKSYVGALVTSVGSVYALNSIMERMSAKSRSLSPLAMHSRIKVLSLFARSIPFLSVAVSKPLQIGFMRQDEMRLGVNIRDDNDEVLGT